MKLQKIAMEDSFGRQDEMGTMASSRTFVGQYFCTTLFVESTNTMQFVNYSFLHLATKLLQVKEFRHFENQVLEQTQNCTISL